jgi:hypothetical protein
MESAGLMARGDDHPGGWFVIRIIGKLRASTSQFRSLHSCCLYREAPLIASALIGHASRFAWMVSKRENMGAFEIVGGKSFEGGSGEYGD